jgi:beta-glucanase (GH16 family)
MSSTPFSAKILEMNTKFCRSSFSRGEHSMPQTHVAQTTPAQYAMRFWYALMVFVPMAMASTPARTAGWEMVFADEFNEQVLDRTKWATRYIYANETLDRFNDEKERYRDNRNHVLSDGSLSLIARKGDADIYESGMIRTHRTFYYGYYEARVFLPTGKGIWPAFWLVGDYDRDGRTWHPPEIDIFEYAVNGIEDKYNMLHSGPKDIGPPGEFSFMDRSFRPKYGEMVGQEPLNEGWHVAGLVWAPDQISFFWDGRRIYSRPYRWLRSDGELGPPAQVVLNFAIGGKNWAGRHGIDEEVYPQAFKIDYVRVCQYTDTERGSALCGDNPQTPDPRAFGYSSGLADMPKPTFLRVTANIGSHPAAGMVDVADGAKPLEITAPIQIPADYPGDRTLNILLYDDATSQIVMSFPYKLPMDSARSGANVNSIKLSIPPLPHPGKYRLEGQVLAKTPGESGNQEVRQVPVSCDTELIQPSKARSCRLLSINQP